ncbi:MAG: hypothetical protein FJ267_16630, partial [Planctomycetes bacterium]|nr:hypothetical protein [Planctomycetota bacterium]
MNRRIAPCFASIVGVVLLASLPARAEEKPFQVFPYLQNPTSEAVTVRWLSKSDEPGVAIVTTPEGERTFRSVPRLAESLGYNTIAPEPGGPHPSPPYLHSVRISGLQAGTEYAYAITQNGQAYRSVFRTASQGDQPV